MNRKNFLRMLGLGAVAAAIFPKITEAKPEPEFTDPSEWEKRLIQRDPNSVREIYFIDDRVEVTQGNISELLRRATVIDENGYAAFKIIDVK